VIYIGKSTRNRSNYLGSGKILLRAIKKYSKENFEKEILEICRNVELDDKEKHWIEKLRSTNHKIGYNITCGGEGGDTFSNNPNKEQILKGRKTLFNQPEIREKMRQNRSKRIDKPLSDNTKKKISKSRNGIKFTSSHKKKLSVARKKRIITKKTREKASKTSKGKINIKKYVLIDPFGNEYITHQGLTLFCEQNNLTISNLLKVLKGERKHHKGWIIKRYKEE